MEKQEIIKSNELIADFMGSTYDRKMGCYWFEIPPTKHSSHGWTELLYHESWDWLMPVVEKIVKEHSAFRMTIGNVATTTSFDNSPATPSKNVEEKPLRSTYKSVVEFIKWYNSTQSNN